jgi:hypothetical protein
MKKLCFCYLLLVVFVVVGCSNRKPISAPAEKDKNPENNYSLDTSPTLIPLNPAVGPGSANSHSPDSPGAPVPSVSEETVFRHGDVLKFRGSKSGVHYFTYRTGGVPHTTVKTLNIKYNASAKSAAVLHSIGIYNGKEVFVLFSPAPDNRVFINIGPAGDNDWTEFHEGHEGGEVTFP